MIVARIFGVILLLIWLYFICHARHYLRQRGSVHPSTVFQYNILPFIVGVSLIVTGNIWILCVLPVAWVLSMIFSPLIYYFSTAFQCGLGGWIGISIYGSIYPWSNAWHWGWFIIGAIAMEVFCLIITKIVTTPDTAILPRPRRKTKMPADTRNVDTKDENGATLLMRAVEDGDLDAVKFLLENGADVNARDANGVTPLGLAMSKGNRDVAEYLMQHGAKE